MLPKAFVSTLLLLIVFVVASCTESPVAPNANDEALVSASKVVVEEVWEYDLALSDPYLDCSTGAPMQNYGILEIHDVYNVTPSGNEIIRSWVDYQALGGVELVNTLTGEIWTLVNGKNPATYVSKENGFFMLAYQWNELYKNDAKQTLHIHVKGHIKIDPDGTVRIDRESSTCR